MGLVACCCTGHGVEMEPFMTLAQVIVLGTLGGLIIELVRNKRAPGVLFASVAFLFMLLDYISMKDALKQFTNNGLITVVVLLLLSIVLDKSRMLELMADKLVRGPYRWALVKLYGTVDEAMQAAAAV